MGYTNTRIMLMKILVKDKFDKEGSDDTDCDPISQSQASAQVEKPQEVSSLDFTRSWS